MDPTGKVAIVTGASAGVGAAVSVKLVEKGFIVVGVARRLSKIQSKELQEQVKNFKGTLVPFKADIARDEDIVRVFDFVRTKYNKLHLLVNNAGVSVTGKLMDGNPEEWKKILDLNVIGLASCAQKAIQLMRDSGVDDGNIINVNSMLGHRIPPVPNPFFNLYPSSKFAVTAISETLRLELRAIGSKIRVTNLSPGVIKTEFSTVATQGKPEYEKTLAQHLAKIPGLEADDLADAVLYIVSAPPHVQIHELQMTAV